MVDYPANCSSMCVAVQEHHALPGALAKAQRDALAEGYRGVWEAALPGQGTGSQGGVAVLVPKRVLITGPPALEGPTLEPGRMVAAHVNCGGKRGFVMISLYMRVDEQLSPENLAILFKLYQYLKVLDTLQMPWIVGGDFNMELKQLGPLSWLHSVNGVAVVPSVPTCMQALPGRTIDFFFVACQVMPRMSHAAVGEADTWPHLPVTLRLAAQPQVMWTRQLVQAKGFTKAPKVGCARPPPDWDPLLNQIRQVTSSEQMADVWDQLLLGIEFELQGRYDVVGPQVSKFTSKPAPPTFEWARFDPDERVYCSKLCDKTARHILEFQYFLKRIAARSDVWPHLDKAAVDIFALGLLAFVREDFDQQIERIIVKAEGKQRAHESKVAASWQAWAEASFEGGASRAHKFSKPLALQEVIDYGAGVQHAYQLADRKVQHWNQYWQRHDDGVIDLPSDHQVWDKLPPLSGRDVRRAVRAFSWTTGTGQ
ncbi:unnamed protein product, partial [Prorocentrum cordatum]